jgi:hypothetical protein
MKCNETQGKWCKNKHGASKIIDTFETYQYPRMARSGIRGSYMLDVESSVGIASGDSGLLETLPFYHSKR